MEKRGHVAGRRCLVPMSTFTGSMPVLSMGLAALAHAKVGPGAFHLLVVDRFRNLVATGQKFRPEGLTKAQPPLLQA
jgi:hypothetical protein